MSQKRFLPCVQNGFVFVDALIATVIVSIALIALIMTYTQSTKVSIAATERQTALYLAQNELESMRQLYEKTAGPVTGHVNSVIHNNKTFSVITTVLPRPASVAAYDKIIPLSVTVSWNTNDNLSLQAYLYLQ